jgi:hypothetical protein
MAMPAHNEWLDQFEEGKSAGGHAGEVEAIPYPAVSPSMTSRRFPAPWRADKIPGGYVVRDAKGQALAYLYSRDSEADARQAKVLTADEARRIALNIARLPELLGKGERQWAVGDRGTVDGQRRCQNSSGSPSALTGPAPLSPTRPVLLSRRAAKDGA